MFKLYVDDIKPGKIIISVLSFLVAIMIMYLRHTKHNMYFFINLHDLSRHIPPHLSLK